LNARPAKIDTAQQILDEAQDLVQTRGFNAFSYADVARALNITKASLHYHFATKAELGQALIERYEARFQSALEAIDARGGTMVERLEAFAAIYFEVLGAGHMCLCGMLAAEFETLPPSMRSALDHYFDETETWLEGVLERGRRDGEFAFEEPAREVAQFVVSTLEGAMILARSHGSSARFITATNRLLKGLASSS
jgi:TetR/AcrR family transcriptional repressor of nem operon